MNNYVKKTIIFIFSVVIFLSVCVVSANADTTIVSEGYCGTEVKYRIERMSGSDYYQLTITGSGNMYDYYINDRRWEGYVDSINFVVIENGVTSIGECAFYGCKRLERISIPESVTSIGNSAFRECSSLESISIPKNVTSIGSCAFYGCSGLKSIIIPKSVTSIGNSAFSGCRSLESISIPKNVTSIGNSAFSGCRSLESISIPESVTSIGSYVFYECRGLKSIIIPKNVTSIGNSAFWGCSCLESVSIPESVTSIKIGENAFASCTSLKSVILPDIEVDIGANAFSNCKNLTSVVLDRRYFDQTDFFDYKDAFPDYSWTASIFHYRYNVEYVSKGHGTITGKARSYGTEEIKLNIIPDENYEIEKVTCNGTDMISNSKGLYQMPDTDYFNTSVNDTTKVIVYMKEKPKNGWIFDGNYTYYYSNGVKLTNWQTINGKKYYFDFYGRMQTGWDGQRYFGDDGVMRTGFQKISGYTYYFDSDGNKVTSWQKINGNEYYFDSNGRMQTGWDGDRYYGDDGVMRTGLHVVDGKTYYFDSYGRIVKGEEVVNGKRYYFNYDDGVAIKGWYGSRYYGDDGAAKTGTHVIDGFVCVFDKDGYLLSKNRPSAPGVGGFIDRLYDKVLGREADQGGKDYWMGQIMNNGKTGADIAKGFLYSPEFLNKGISNYEFLEILYNVFFDRPSDDGGMSYWLSKMAGGMSKQDVIMGFINSTEWANVCLSYGIPSGGNGVPNKTITPNEKVVAFATRLYTTCLGRNADQGGLDYWAGELANMRVTGTSAAHGFFFSTELLNKNISNDDYITRLYRTFMGREPDQGGFDYWMGKFAAGASREEVFQGFAQSREFGEICASYGILR